MASWAVSSAATFSSASRRSVSYTHLDVYKRQDLGNALQTVTNNVLKELQADSAGITVQEYGVTMDISDLNGVQSIEIPTEAQGAINYEQEITSMNESDAA